MTIQAKPLSTENNIVEQSCIVCQQPIRSYAFTINHSKFFRCDNCHAIVRQTIDAKAEADNAPRIIDRDIQQLSKQLVATLHDRSAKEPYLVISISNDDGLTKKVQKLLPTEVTYLEVANVRQHPNIQYGAVVLLVPPSIIFNYAGLMTKIQDLLLPNGTLIFLQPMLDSAQAKLLKSRWPAWRQPHKFYFTRDSLHILLLNQGFDQVWFCKARYPYTLEYINYRLKNTKEGILRHFCAVLGLPILRKLKFRLPSSHIITSCQLAEKNKQPTLSIVLPVYNEEKTFEELLKVLLAKQLNGLRKQIIIVESNSTDNTAEIVKKYQNHPDIQVIWQSQAKGKGFAVREGLAAATGDYVLIQDADLEYDINDYDALLEPLRKSQVMFVLGSRHSGSWKIREFNDAATTAAIFNIGHIFFTWFVNLLTRQHMADPFTMFKVLRRDAFFGINFTCKRFDFDHEMVIKLIRKGYQPLELPVNYQARSFAEGKKVSFVKDGLTWISTDLKLRFGRLGKFPD